MQKRFFAKAFALVFCSLMGVFCSALEMRVGAFGDYEPTVGDLHEFVHCSAGGGVEYEIGFRLPFNLEIGPAVHFAVNGNPVRDERLASMMILKMDVGAFLRVPILNSGFFFEPEIDYGCFVYFPKASPDYVNSLQPAYADQLLQVGVGFRYAPPMILSGDLEFEITPTYTFSTEKTSSEHFIGFRVGVLYRVYTNEGQSAQNQQ